MDARKKRVGVKASGDDRRKHFLFPSFFSTPMVCKTVQYGFLSASSAARCEKF